MQIIQKPIVIEKDILAGETHVELVGPLDEIGIALTAVHTAVLAKYGKEEGKSIIKSANKAAKELIKEGEFYVQ